ncbi:hypothetical protein D3C76_1385760 [compost metagenome]
MPTSVSVTTGEPIMPLAAFITNTSLGIAKPFLMILVAPFSIIQSNSQVLASSFMQATGLPCRTVPPERRLRSAKSPKNWISPPKRWAHSSMIWTGSVSGDRVRLMMRSSRS